MTQVPPHDSPNSPPHAAEPPGTWLGAIWSSAQLLVALAGTGYVLYLLLTMPLGGHDDEAEAPKGPPPAVEAVGPALVRIRPDSKIAARLKAASAEPVRVTSPLLNVTGTVVASMRPHNGEKVDWQFHSPEVLTAYTDLRKASADVTFLMAQLGRVRELADTRVESQKKVVARLEKLVAAGTDTPKDLAAERTNLLQYTLLGKKEVHEAETALRVAQRNQAALGQQLRQAGLEPALLDTGTPDMDIVMADVPETSLRQVKVGQACQARFFGLPDATFSGRVNSIAAVISRERRSLRVLFVLKDPDDHIRPGMFAEIGLGVDPRDTLQVAADGLVHIGQKDYVLVDGGEPGLWRVTEVSVGEPQGQRVEVFRGLKPGDRVLGKGAVLLKPVMVQALRTTDPVAAGGGR